MMFIYKYRKFNERETYHKFIIPFLFIAYVTRIIEIIYLITDKPNAEFNRSFGHNKSFEILIVYAPLLFHGLTAMTYAFRWASYYILIAAKYNLNEIKVSWRLKVLKITFLI